MRQHCHCIWHGEAAYSSSTQRSHAKHDSDVLLVDRQRRYASVRCRPTTDMTDLSLAVVHVKVTTFAMPFVMCKKLALVICNSRMQLVLILVCKLSRQGKEVGWDRGDDLAGNKQTNLAGKEQTNSGKGRCGSIGIGIKSGSMHSASMYLACVFSWASGPAQSAAG